MKIFFKTSLKLFPVLIFLAVVTFGSGSKNVHAASTQVWAGPGNCDGGMSAGLATFNVSTDRDTYAGGAQIIVSASVDLFSFMYGNSGGCTNPSASMTATLGGTTNFISMGPSGTSATVYSGSTGFIAPCAAGTYTINLTGTVYPSGGSQPISGTGSVTITSTGGCRATVNVNVGTCPATTSWSANNGSGSGTGSGSYFYVPSASGDNVSITGFPPSGYTWTGTSPNSQMIYSGGNYSYTLNCTGVPPPPSSVNLSASVTSMTSCGQTSTLSWSSTGATSCTAPWTSSNATSGSQSGIGAGTYSITCSNSGGSRQSNPVTITSSAGSCSVPTVTVTATPASITSGGSSTVTWSTTNATSCSSDWWSGSTALSGSVSVNPAVTTTYTKTCTNANGTNSGSATVTVTPATTAGISVSSNVAGASWTISPGSLSGSGTSGSYTVTPASGGTSYTISPSAVSGYSGPTVVNDLGSGGAVMTIAPGQTGTYTLDYTLVPPFDYSLSNSGTTSITKGGIDQYGVNTLRKTLISGTSQAVTLSLSGVPSGVSYAISSQTCSPTCTSTVTFTVTPAATPGNYTIVATGSPGGKTTSFTLNIVASPAIVVTCTPSPAVALIGNPVTWTSTVSGGNGVYTSYVWTGTNIPTAPAPSTSSFAITYSTIGQKTAQLTVTDSIGNTGTCTPAGSVQVKFNPQFKEF